MRWEGQLLNRRCRRDTRQPQAHRRWRFLRCELCALGEVYHSHPISPQRLSRFGEHLDGRRESPLDERRGDLGQLGRAELQQGQGRHLRNRLVPQPPELGSGHRREERRFVLDQW